MTITEKQNGRVVELADAVREALFQAAPGAFCLPFESRVSFAPILDVSKVSDKTVSMDILPGADGESREGGGTSPVFSGFYGVHLVLQRRVGAGAEADAYMRDLMLLRTQLTDFFKGMAVVASGCPHPFKAVLARMEADEPYILERLIQDHVFLSELVLVFKAAIA